MCDLPRTHGDTEGVGDTEKSFLNRKSEKGMKRNELLARLRRAPVMAFRRFPVFLLKALPRVSDPLRVSVRT